MKKILIILLLATTIFACKSDDDDSGDQAFAPKFKFTFNWNCVNFRN